MNQKLPRVAVFISGGGTGLQALINASRDGSLHAEIALVVSSKAKAYGLQRAAEGSIVSFVFKVKKYESPDEASKTLLERLIKSEIDYIALAGYLSLLPIEVVKHYRNRIVNIHPALLPMYGGKGMYGHHVHEAVLAAGDKESGCTVHLVDEIYDNGRILDQAKVEVLPDDDIDSLAARVLVEEHRLYPEVLEKLINGEYDKDE